MIRRAASRLAALSVALSSACSGGTSTPPVTASSPSSSTASSANTLIYVSDASGVIYGFPTATNGVVAPTVAIEGSRTGLVGPASLARDAQGNLYVAEGPIARVDVFAPGATGNVAPVRSIQGSSTELTPYSAVAIGPSDTLYAATQANSSSQPNCNTTIDACILVTVGTYPAASSGNTSPTSTFSSIQIPPNTSPGAVPLAVAPNGAVETLATNLTNTRQLAVFQAGASGIALPSQFLLYPAGDTTGIFASALAIDQTGTTYVANVIPPPFGGTGLEDQVAVSEFPPGSTSATVPTLLPVAIAAGGTSQVAALAVDGAQTVYILVNNTVTTVSPERESWTIYVLPKATKPQSNGLYLPTATISTKTSAPTFATSLAL